jgi:molybdopterin converting factor small subunit
MTITIRLFSDMKKYLPGVSEGDHRELDLDSGSTIGQLKRMLGIPGEKDCVVTVNDTNRKDEHVLDDKDTVKIFPTAMGG